MERIEGLFAAMRAASQELEWPATEARDSGLDTAGELAERYAQAVSEALCGHFRSSHASLWLLDGEPGAYRLRWRYDLGDARVGRLLGHPGGLGWDWHGPRPLVADGVVYVGSGDGSLHAVDAASHGGSAEQAFRRVQASRALIVGVTTDFLFPLHQQEELANALRVTVPEVDFRALPSINGHDSFLVDMARFRPTVASFF